MPDFAITLDSKDLDNLSKYISRNPDLVMKNMGPTMKRAALMTEGVMKKEAPVDTGKLRQSVKSTISPLLSTIKPTAKYAAAVHNGSPARTIRPVKAKALRFKIKGKWIYARKAHLPARRGNPFVKRTLDKVQGKVTDMFVGAMNSILNQLKHGK